MTEPEFARKVMSVIKRQATARGLTQDVLAQRLDVSLPTVKRWLSGQGVTLDTMKSVADQVGLSFVDIASEVDEAMGPFFNYTEEQEEYFAHSPDCLAFFDHLLRGYTPAKIRRKFQLPTIQMERYLSQLEKLGLIEWRPKNRVLLRTTGEPEWRKDGPLSARFRSEIRREFFDARGHRIDTFLLHDLLPEDQERLERKIAELIDLAKQGNIRAALHTERSNPVGIAIVLKDFRWKLDSFLR